MSHAPKYWLVLHSRADASVDPETKHASFFERIRELPGQWGGSEMPVPPMPRFKGGSSASTNLTKYLGRGIHRAMVTYRYRRMLSDDGLSDDLLNIVFNPHVVSLGELLLIAVPRYIEAFDAYLAEYFDDAVIDLPPEGNLKAPNPRTDVKRVGPVSYFDDLLCRRAFGIAPELALARCQGEVEHGELVAGGVYLLGSSKVLSMSEARSLSERMTRAIRGR